MTIELKNVTKYFQIGRDKHYILDNVSCILKNRKNIAIIGRNGAGKTSFLKLLCKALYPDSGEIYTDETISWPVGSKGFLQKNFSARENVNFSCMMLGVNKVKNDEVMEFVKKHAKLGDFFDRPMNIYSTGMKSRLAFILSIAFDFDTYLLDETTSAGDVEFNQKAMQLLSKKLQKSRIIMVSKNNKIIKNTCQEAILIEKGKIIHFKDVSKAIGEYKRIVGEDNEENEIQQIEMFSLN